ncbi:NADH-cytochrome b5 reductase [Apiospora aurea]|uniref:NADH-cytochrome b5 reductase n=1 Tax=Apiospora aurea TaxID=335848 RepID=A0ABR1QM94_9PEZI
MAMFQRVRPSYMLGGVAAAGIGLTLLSRNLTSDASAATGAPRKIFPGGPAFLALPLESSEMVNHNTKRLRFKLPQPDSITGLPLESSLVTFAWPKGHWKPTGRPYTPITPSDEPGFFELLVKHYPGGGMSTHLHSLQPGDSLRFVHPHITLIAGGAGITPMFQMVQGILRDPQDTTRISLVFGVNSDADLLLKDEFDRFEKLFPGRFQVTYTVSRPSPGSPHREGYVTRELLKEVLPAGGSSKVFVCGPLGLEDALVGGKGKPPGILEQLGYGKDKVHKF